MRREKLSSETRRKISEALRGENNPMWGKKHSLESRQKISEAKQGEKNYWWGRDFSPEHRRKISEAKQGHEVLLETRRKISESMRGKRHWNWKGGQTNHFDYVLLLKPNHPNSDPNGYIYEHRLVMEEILGRFLKSEEVVHHINGNPADNHKENLMFFSSNKKHMVYHRRNREV